MIMADNQMARPAPGLVGDELFGQECLVALAGLPQCGIPGLGIEGFSPAGDFKSC